MSMFSLSSLAVVADIHIPERVSNIQVYSAGCEYILIKIKKIYHINIKVTLQFIGKHNFTAGKNCFK